MLAFRAAFSSLYAQFIKPSDSISNYYQFHIEPHKTILVIGDLPAERIAACKPATLYQWDTNSPQSTAVDYVIIQIDSLEDIQQTLLRAQAWCSDKTRVILQWPAAWTELSTFFFNTTQKKALNRPLIADMRHMLFLSDYEIVHHEQVQFALTYYIPLISRFLDTFFVHIPWIKNLCMQRFCIARSILQKKSADCSVSIIITCRNERGNIYDAIARLPVFGTSQEIIFVEGHSHDHTLEEIYRVQKLFSDKNINVLVQQGKGKGDAVRTGFAAATGEILMILDGDLTMPPEELPKFYQALIENKGEFINGSRLMYHRESEAMPRAAVFPNYCFALGFSWLLGQRITDTLCGTKVLWRRDYEALAQNRHFFGDFDPFGDFDLLFGAAKRSLKIIDLPIRYKNRTYGTTQIKRFSAGIQLLRMFLLGVSKFKFK